jgi:LytS/YehU family sensor histidine kinase
LYQLESLRAQINPHFLFNSLNSIYSLALQRSGDAPEVILKLSDVLRYVIYDSNQDKVELEKELDFISKYIDLQKLRTHVAGKIHYSVNGESEGKKTAPLIFIVFIENAFKHGLQADIENQFINIKFNITGQRIEFVSENNTGETGGIETKDNKGIGLENVKKRLEIMYPGKYKLAIRNDPDKYSVRLNLEI